MAFDTILEQGRFTSTGANVTLDFRQSVDWIRTYNETALAQAAADLEYEFYWQRGMEAAGGQQGVFWTKLGAVAADPVTVGQLVANAGFRLVDSSVLTATVGPAVITNIAAGPPPRVTSAAHTLVTGDVVRLENTVGAVQLDGVDFHVTRIDANNFDLTFFPLAVAAAAAPGAIANFRLLSNEGIYVPKNRIVTNITAAAQAVVTMAAPHDFTVGQSVKFQVPRVTGVAYGMTEIDGLEGTVVAAVATNAANTVTVDINSTGFTAFAFPLTADTPFTQAQLVPVGMDTGQALTAGVDILAGATDNIAILGMTLVGGAAAPAGANNDIISWVAGKSFAVNN